MNVYEDMTAAGDVTADEAGWVHIEGFANKLDPDEADRLARVLVEAAAAARAALAG